VTGINDAGVVVGWSTTAGDVDRHAFLWQGGSMTDLGTLGGNSSEAVGINRLGQIAGNSAAADGATHAVLWQSGTMTDLGTLGGSASELPASTTSARWSAGHSPPTAPQMPSSGTTAR